MDRPQPAETGPGQIEIERREGELPGDEIADQEACQAPEDGGDHSGADHAVGIARLGAGLRPFNHLREDVEKSEARGAEQDAAVKGHDRVFARNGQDQADQGQNARGDERHGVGKSPPLVAFEHARHGSRSLPPSGGTMGKPRRLSLDEDQKAARNVGSRATDSARALIGLPAFGVLAAVRDQAPTQQFKRALAGFVCSRIT